MHALLRKRPFSVAAVLTLALGIGATTAVYSVLEAVLLRPLPFKDPGRLVIIWDNDIAINRQTLVSFAHFEQYRQNSQTLTSPAAVGRSSRVWTGRGPARRLSIAPASVSFFDTMGVNAVLGRTFQPEDQQRGCVIVLEHGFWSTELNGDASVVGKDFALDETPCTVLGVMPADFSAYPTNARLWMLIGDNFEKSRRQLDGVAVYGRLKAGVTLAQARAEIDSIHRTLYSRDPDERNKRSTVDGLQSELAYLAGPTLRTTLVLVFTAVILVLLIACVNVANLLLAGMSERSREFALRGALGATRGDLMRQVLGETILLSAGGAIAGVAIATGVVRYLRWANPIALPAHATVALDLPVLLFTCVVAAATTVIAGILPALHANKSAGRFTNRPGVSVDKRGWASLRWLLAVEMGVTFMLLIGADQVMRAALGMAAEPSHIDPSGVVTSTVVLRGNKYSDLGARTSFYDTVRGRLEGLPGVTGVAFGTEFPPYRGVTSDALEVLGQPEVRARAGDSSVGPGFFTLLRTPLRFGRDIDSSDRDDSLPVAIVNQALQRAYFGDRNPIGQQIRFSEASERPPWMTVVGVVATIKDVNNEASDTTWLDVPMVYRPIAQHPPRGVEVGVRVLGNLPARLIREQVSAVDSTVPVDDPKPLSGRVADVLAYPRFRALFLGAFAAIALSLSAVGLFGVLSQVISQRAQEFGVRRALGAQSSHLLKLVAWEGGVPVVAGVALGLVGASGFRRVIQTVVPGTIAADARSLAFATLILLMVALVAMLKPARRAAGADPMIALREER